MRQSANCSKANSTPRASARQSPLTPSLPEPGPVKNLIEDVLPTEDEELTSQSNRLRDKIINLPMIVCYGSDNIVLMETK